MDKLGLESIAQGDGPSVGKKFNPGSGPELGTTPGTRADADI